MADPLLSLSNASSICGIVGFGISTYADLTDDTAEQLEQINGKLDAILTGIAELETQLNVMDEKLNEILYDMKIDTLTLLTYVDESQLSDPISFIETKYSETPKIGLRWFAKTKPDADGLLVPVASKTEIKTFAANAIGTTGGYAVPQAITDISDVLVVGGANNPGLLKGWTNLCIAKMGVGGNSEDLWNSYLLLEGYFLQQVNYQAKGLYILQNAYSTSPSEDGALSDNAQDYLNGDFATLIRAQVDKFRECAEELVLSQIKENVRLPTKAGQVLSRCDLIHALVERNFVDGQPPGLFGRCFARPGAIQYGSPEYQPSGFEPSSGAVASGHTTYRTIDFNYIDFNDEGPQLTLSRPEESLIQVVRYYWPWPPAGPPASGSSITIAPGGLEAPVQYYNEVTFDLTDSQDEQAVPVASFIEARFWVKSWLYQHWSEITPTFKGSVKWAGDRNQTVVVEDGSNRTIRFDAEYAATNPSGNDPFSFVTSNHTIFINPDIDGTLNLRMRAKALKYAYDGADDPKSKYGYTWATLEMGGYPQRESWNFAQHPTGSVEFVGKIQLNDMQGTGQHVPLYIRLGAGGNLSAFHPSEQYHCSLSAEVYEVVVWWDQPEIQV